MNKYQHAALHGFASLTGWLRLFFAQPRFALSLLGRRWNYFVSRRFIGQLATPDGFRVESATELISYWSFFIEREGWAADWIADLRRESAPLILDVGANAGLFTHWVWTQNPRARFVLFEPLPTMAARIRQWVVCTGADVTLHQTAVSDYSGEAKFFLAADNDTGASLRDDNSKTSSLIVPLATLDALVPREPILMAKIDVEGCELEVLRGATETLPQIRYLLLEAHTPQALANIRQVLNAPQWTSRRVGSNDYLFKRRTDDNV
jgi:FkbM family methyltransferase